MDNSTRPQSFLSTIDNCTRPQSLSLQSPKMDCFNSTSLDVCVKFTDYLTGSSTKKVVLCKVVHASTFSRDKKEIWKGESKEKEGIEK